MKVVAGYDIDDSCRFAYEENNEGARFYNESVTSLKADELARLYPKAHLRVLVGCAPCQTFSKYTQGLSQANDPKWTLLTKFARLVRELEPDVVSMENVPELANYRIFSKFLSVLRESEPKHNSRTQPQAVLAIVVVIGKMGLKIIGLNRADREAVREIHVEPAAECSGE